MDLWRLPRGKSGAVADTDGNVEIQIRDLDQTVIGNPAHDLIRLALSLATAARGSDLPGVTTAHILEQMIEGYERALANRAGHNEPAAKPVRFILKQALKREWRHLAKERIEDVSPAIPLGKCFWALSKQEREEIDRIFQTEEIRRLITSLHSRDNDGDVKVLDAAYWMKGCSSLGRLRYAVLLGLGKAKHHGGLCLVDIKEAVQAAAPHAKRATMPRDNAMRIVQGACKLSPFLGERMLATRFTDRAVVIRELLPQDLKLEMDRLTCDEAVQAARSWPASLEKRMGGRWTPVREKRGGAI